MATLAHSYTIKLKVGNKPGPEQLNPYRDAIRKLENPDNKKMILDLTYIFLNQLL